MNIKMTAKLHLILILSVFTLFNCKQENTFSEYQYADKEQVIACDNCNSKLFNEALYSFENDLLNFYGKEQQNLTQAYSKFIRLGVYGSAKYEDMVSPHTLKVFEALKKEADLWNLNNPKSNLNYNSQIVECISKNLQNTALKTTYNALISTNSMSPKLFGPPLISNFRTAIKDKYLAAYIALDLYYAKLFDIDFSKIDFNKPKQSVDFNKLQKN